MTRPATGLERVQRTNSRSRGPARSARDSERARHPSAATGLAPKGHANGALGNTRAPEEHRMKRMLIVGSDAFALHGMRFALEHTQGLSLYCMVEGAGQLRTALREAQPDIVVLDGVTAPESAIRCADQIREEAPDALVLLVTTAGLSAEDSARALDAGVVVCLWRDAELRAPDAGETIRAADTRPTTSEPEPAAPASPLTAREREILRWVTEGHTNASIGRKLWVTEQTVKFHLSNIYRKLGVSNRTEASHYALVNRLVGVPGNPGVGLRVVEPPEDDDKPRAVGHG
jgi:DNA-binding NarL/FixJ family response regulator